MNLPPSQSPRVHVTKCDGGVTIIELDNPPANALSEGVRQHLCRALDDCAADTSLRAVILAARGRLYCSGDDLKEASACTDRPASIASFQALFARIEELHVPVIAAINGACAGGGLELALCCDIRIMSVDARLIASGANVGLIGSAVRLSRLIGVSRAKGMLFTGQPIGAQDALASGLVFSIHDREGLLDAAKGIAGRIATRAPLSIRAIKRIVTAFPSAAEALLHEKQALVELASTRDHREAIEAFSANRNPEFVGA